MAAARSAGSKLDKFDLFALVVALGIWLRLALRSKFLIDDAFICFRYAQNWSEGLGLRFNLQNPVPVEGYSDFLWVSALALAQKLGANPIVAAHVLSFSASAATLILLLHFLRSTCGIDRWAAYGGLLFCATLPSFFVWSSGGLETAAVGLALFATWSGFVRAAERNSRRSAILAGLAGGALALLRVEGILWVPLAYALAVGWKTRGADESRQQARRTAARRLLPGLVLPLLIFGAYVVFRRVHFEAWLPNTVHAKAGLSSQSLLRGLRTTASYFVVYASPLVILALSFRLRAAGAKRAIGVQALLLFVAFLGWNTVVGGDWMPFFRFLAPATTLLAVVFAFGLHRLHVGLLAPLVLGLCTLSLLPAWNHHAAPKSLRVALAFREFQNGYQTEFARWASGFRNVRTFRRIGRALALAAEPTDTLVYGAIGAVGYESGMEIYDRNGLVTPKAAKYEGEQWITGHDTAGHERRLARSFFFDDSPTFLDAAFLTHPVGPVGTPMFDKSVAFLIDRISREGHPDALLFDHCIAEVHNFTKEDGFPDACALLVLRYVPDVERARAFWSAYSARRGG